MTAPGIKKTLLWPQFISGLLLAISFFLPWVNWDGSEIKGSGIATGDFFGIAASRFGLENPFPQLSFSFYFFWLIPLLGILCAVLACIKKRTTPFAYIAGAMGLGLITMYYLFSNILVDLGVGKTAISMLKPAIWLHALAAIGLITTAYPVKTFLPKLLWLLAGPVVAYAAFSIGEKQVMSESFKDSGELMADYTVSADSLLREFIVNDSSANRKYLEKMLVVNGNASAVEIKPDSTSTIKFTDSTGSYAIFSLEKDQLEAVQGLTTGSPVSIKGVCSGSIYSDILGTTAINFKRSTLNKIKQP